VTEKGSQVGSGSRDLTIDFDGMEDRIEPFPVPEGIYEQIEALRGKVLFTSLPVDCGRESTIFSQRDQVGSHSFRKSEIEMNLVVDRSRAPMKYRNAPSGSKTGAKSARTSRVTLKVAPSSILQIRMMELRRLGHQL
jgi:tricorn protease-like protein